MDGRMGGEGLSKVREGGDKTDPMSCQPGRRDFRLGGGTVRAGAPGFPRCPSQRGLAGPGRAWQVGWGCRLHHPIRSPAAAPARDRLIPLCSTADILDSSARTCSP